MKKINIILLSLILINGVTIGQEKDPYAILKSVKDEFQKIEDYSVDIIIDVDVEFLKAPQSKAKIFFKQPGKVKMESEGFAMLPKQGLDFSPSKLFEGDYTAIYIDPDTINTIPVEIIKVIPDDDSLGIILSKLWVDPNQKVIRKIETTSKSSGTFSIELSYNDPYIKLLPSEVHFKFDLGGIELPASFTGNFDPDNQPEKKGEGTVAGTVTIKYKNYIINQGLPDTLFEKNE